MGGSGIPKSKSFTTFCITFSSRWIRASISRLLFASPSSRPPKHILNNCAVAEEPVKFEVFAPLQRQVVSSGWEFSGRCFELRKVEVSEYTRRDVCTKKGELS